MPTQPQLDCTAVLMTGGKSSRMGQDKAWLDYHGRPLWQVQVEKLGFAREILISAREETFSKTRPEYPLVFDEVSGKGPLAGLHAALKLARYKRVLLLAVDMPAMTAGYLRGLVESSTSSIGVVPETGSFYQGLAAVYPRSIFPLLNEIISGEDVSFQHLCKRALAEGLMKSRRVQPADEIFFQNWNRLEDRS